MEILCMILGVVCLGYYGLMLAVGMDFSFIWLAGGIVLAGGGIWMKFAGTHGIHLPGAVKAAGGIVLAAGLLVFLTAEGLIFSKMNEKGEKNLDYVIVLGAQVRGDVPSRALKKRIQKAEDYLKENPETIAVLSGGKRKGKIFRRRRQCMKPEKSRD